MAADRSTALTQLVVVALAGAVSATSAQAGHSRSGYLDAGQSVDGRFVVTARRVDDLDKKGRRADHRWIFTWRDNRNGEERQGELRGLGSGTSDVFDPVNAHIFVAPSGDTFAVWMPQSMARIEQKKPKELPRSSDKFRNYAGFQHRLTIYRKTGEVVRRFDVRDFLLESDWEWLYDYGRQVYWLVAYPGLSIDTTPRSGYALYRISPDYTVLEFQIGANPEATFHAKRRGVAPPPPPRTVRVRLTDGRLLTGEPIEDANRIPVRPFVGELSNRGRQANYEPGLDPVRQPGRYVKRDKSQKPVALGRSSPSSP